MKKAHGVTAYLPITTHTILASCALLFLFSGCATFQSGPDGLEVEPEGYTARVHGWMAEASRRYEGRAWGYDYYKVEIVPDRYQIRDGKGGMIWVYGNSVGTHASGRYRSRVSIRHKGDRNGVWEALNVLSAIHDGQMLDGKQPKKGGRINWPK